MNNNTRDDDDDDFHARRIAAARAQWRWVGEDRPPFALKPEPTQESVWDYPRPPRLASDGREVIVMAGDVEVARSCSAVRVLETASPPGFYLPPCDVRMELLSPAPGQSFCEWKGDAQYWSVRARDRWLQGVAWSYPEPLSGFEVIAGYFGFYPQHLVCLVEGVRVLPQPGRFYAGWITPEVVGPFKGEPGSSGW